RPRRRGRRAPCRGRSLAGSDDDVAVRLGPLGARLDTCTLLQEEMHDLALDRGHRLELDLLAARTHLLRRPERERLERRTSPLAVARCVDDDLLARVVAAAVRNRVHEVLDR